MDRIHHVPGHVPGMPVRGALRFAGVVALFLVTSAGMCGGPQVPEADVCDRPGNPTVSALEIGSATLDEVFVPWQDGEDVTVVVGGQGSPMFPMRVRIQGEDAACISLATRVVPDSGDTLAEELLALSAYRQDDGSYITDTHWVVMYGGFPAPVPATVEITVGGATTTRAVVLRLQ